MPTTLGRSIFASATRQRITPSRPVLMLSACAERTCCVARRCRETSRAVCACVRSHFVFEVGKTEIVAVHRGLHQSSMARHEAMRRTHMLTQETTGWSELVAISATMTALNHDLDRWQDDDDESGDDDGRPLAFFAGTWPRTNVIDAGSSVIVTAEVPGLTRDDVQLGLNANVLTLSGERVSVAPQRYAVQHQERTHSKFSRSV